MIYSAHCPNAYYLVVLAHMDHGMNNYCDILCCSCSSLNNYKHTFPSACLILEGNGRFHAALKVCFYSELHMCGMRDKKPIHIFVSAIPLTIEQAIAAMNFSQIAHKPIDRDPAFCLNYLWPLLQGSPLPPCHQYRSYCEKPSYPKYLHP